MRSLIAASLLLLVSCRTFPKPDDVRDFHWRDGGAVKFSNPATVNITHAPSSAVSFLFTNLTADLQPSSTELGAIASGVVGLPLDPGRAVATPVRCQIKGNVISPPGSTTWLLAQLGSEAEVFDLSGTDGNFTKEIRMSVPGGAAQQFPVTIVVRAERETVSTAVRIEVDSVDCSVDFGPPAS